MRAFVFALFKVFSWRVIVIASIVFFVSGVEFALADDLHLLEAGAGTSSTAPPNIVFLFDSSNSMYDLICEDLSGTRQCSKNQNMTLISGPNSSMISVNSVLEGLSGPDVTGDSVADPYRSLYNSDGTTYRGTRYPIFDERKSGPTDDMFPPWNIYTHNSVAFEYTVQATGSGTTEQDKFDDVISTICSSSSVTDNCYQKSRCIYSMRTHGYFWEPADNASGDPLNMCSSTPTTPTAPDLGGYCSHGYECTSGICKSHICSMCSGGSGCSISGCYYYKYSYKYCIPYSGGSGATTGGLNKDYPYVLGDFLNFYPTKVVALVKAFTDTINNMSGDVRIGISDFNDSGNIYYPATGSSGSIQYAVKPPCSQTTGTACFDGDPATQCFNPSDSNLINYLYNGYTLDWGTPLAMALDNVGKYFTTTTGVNTPICDYGSSVCTQAKNFVVLITDGFPMWDATAGSRVPFVNGEVTGMSDGYYKNQGMVGGLYQYGGSLVDDVAYALTQLDMRSDISGLQDVKTYAVSYGITDETDPTKCYGLLDDVATGGSGKCLPATSVAELRDALTEIISDILHRTVGFTAPSVPATNQSGQASVANAVFRPSDEFSLWEGHIYGFTFCDVANSALLGNACTCPSGDSTCILDANGAIAPIYDSDGYLSSKPLWDSSLCLAGDVAGTLGVVPSDQGDLDVSSCYVTAANRVIKTAVPDTSLPPAYTQIDFTEANVTTGSRFLAELGTATVSDGQKLVNFFRGLDVYDIDGDTNTSEERNLNNIQHGGQPIDGWWKLGDIFHSIPATLQRPGGSTDVGAWAATASYQGFQSTYTSRSRVMLVGANDGMLHAFLTGVWDANAGIGGAYIEDTSSHPELGKELWAFVSPEMLPRLKDMCNPATHSCGLANHKFMVDGSVMVRDIWIDPTADKNIASNKTKWKTVAIYGHRDGGQRYVALDVTDATNPVFLWQFPAPSSSEDALMANSWLDVYPSPASIGPLAWDHDNNPATKAVDRWVVLLSGGYDPLDIKGNALFMLDAYTGAVLWKVTYAVSSATATMKYSFPATPVFYARNTEGGVPMMAGIVAADHGGQIWHIPTPASALSSGVFNFTPQVIFKTTNPLITSNGDTTLANSEYQRWPFFFAPTLTRYQGKERIIIGTGDRDYLIPNPLLSTTINGYICSDQQRLYSMVLESCSTSSVTRPCTESDLTEINIANNTWATSSSRGWYYKLPAGEKVVAPFNISRFETMGTISPFAEYSVFAPTAVCGGGGSSDVCSAAQSKGDGKLYAFDWLTGKPVDWNHDNAITVADASASLGQGVPAAPATTSVITSHGATTTLISGSSDSGLTTLQVNSGSQSLVVEILRLDVSRELHNALH